jgi:hypothetical protein
MYREYPLLATPADDKKLWRYMDLSQFLWLLYRKSLYFSELGEFTDKWEGALPKISEARLRENSDYKSLIDAGVSEAYARHTVERSQKERQVGYAVNCWHMNEVESIAMWKLYTAGNDGIAIQTTVGRLKACLQKEKRDIFIVEVQYRDHEEGPFAESHDPLVPLMTKRRSYMHEREVRIILDKAPGQGFYEITLANYASGTSGSEPLSVDLETLIERIVAAPTYPQWAVGSLRWQLLGTRLPKIETSDLLKLPQLTVVPHEEEPDFFHEG